MFDQVSQQILRGARLEPMILDELFTSCGFRHQQFPREGSDGGAVFQGSTQPIATPEWHAARFPRCRYDEHSVMRDLDGFPGRGAQQEHVAGSCFEDHFFVQLADTRRALAAVRQKDPVQTAVWNRSRVGDRQPLRAAAG